MTEPKANPASKFLAQRGVIPDHQKAVADELVSLRNDLKAVMQALSATNLKLSSIMVRLDMPAKSPAFMVPMNAQVTEKPGCDCA